LVGTTTLFKSVNGGSNFIAVGGYYGNFSIHPDIQDIKMLTSGDTWVSTDGGMSFTSDVFSSQQNCSARTNGIVGSDMWGFDQGWNEDIVVGGRYHNGNTAIADFYQPKALQQKRLVRESSNIVSHQAIPWCLTILLFHPDNGIK
jgi:hypothetical protein